jgi:hypothetical protein
VATKWLLDDDLKEKPDTINLGDNSRRRIAKSSLKRNQAHKVPKIKYRRNLEPDLVFRPDWGDGMTKAILLLNANG